MRIFKKKTLRDFFRGHPDAEQPLRAWYAEASNSEWKTPHDVRRDYPKASILGDELVVFDVCHNRYRLAANVVYTKGWVFIVFIGTHKEYDRWNRSRK